MMNGAKLLLTGLLGLAHDALAQQISGAEAYMPYTGLTQACMSALNTTVSCPLFLQSVAVDGSVLSSDQATSLCVSSCLTSLETARHSIAGACTATTDVLVINDVAYPPTYIADSYLLTYNVSCRQDSSTGSYCDPLIASWTNQTFLNTSQLCSDCWLGSQRLLLESPLQYDAGLASNFAALTAFCNASGYGYVAPTGTYALNGSATSATATPTTTTTTCISTYTVKASDNCTSVSAAHNVSTFDLLYQNGIDIYCQNFNASVGQSLCIPNQCDTYTWQGYDTCDSVVGALPGVTIPQFLSWNPNFNSLCQNGLSFIGYTVCLSPPGGYSDHESTSLVNETTAAISAAPVPTNAMTGSSRNCGRWYTIVEGDTCALVSVANYLSLSDFLFLNPEITANCTNLDLGEAYCVEPVGDLATYSGYTSSAGPSITVPPATFSSVNTAIPTNTANPGFIYTTSTLPHASGTPTNCTDYWNYDSSGNDNSCLFVAYANEIDTDELLSWNPSLPTDIPNCSLSAGYSYCVAEPGSASSSSIELSGHCLTVNGTEPGTASTCSCFTLVYGEYNSNVYGCQDIASDFSVSLSELTTWNTWLGSNCDANLYADLASSDSRALCVAVNASEPVGTATSPPKSPTQTTGTMGPTQTGVVNGCQQFYTVQSGDTCYNIETEFSISFDQFYAWNPSVGSNCENLWLGYAYCVQGPPSTSTSAPPATTATTIVSGAPTQSGITSNCAEYYTVASGDSCSQIETAYSITFAQLYNWNPAIGSNCQNLWVGYAVCVAVSS